jgi:hypothetical protein
VSPCRLSCSCQSAPPAAQANSSRLLSPPQVEAGLVSGQLLSGDYSLSAQQLTATLFEGAGVDQPAGTLLVLPFARMPAARLRLKLDWKLPNGRQPDQHHLFPHVPPQGRRQEPVVVSARADVLGTGTGRVLLGRCASPWVQWLCAAPFARAVLA